MGPTLIPGNQQSSSIWKVGKEGGKCNFLLFDDKRVALDILFDMFLNFK